MVREATGSARTGSLVPCTTLVGSLGRVSESSIRRTNGYYAGAKGERVTPAPSTPGMLLALIEPGGYLNFATPMPFADKSGPLEQGILNQAGHISRRPQAAVRGLSQPVWPMKISFCRARISPSSIRLFAKREPPSFPMRRGKEIGRAHV